MTILGFFEYLDSQRLGLAEVGIYAAIIALVIWKIRELGE